LTSRQEVHVPDIQSAFFRYHRAGGHLRIWRKDGDDGRSADDFLPSGEPLDLDELRDGVWLYAEGVNGSPYALPINLVIDIPGVQTITDRIHVLPFDAATGLEETEIVGFTIHHGSTNGTPGNDIILGTDADDTLTGGAGDDIIVAGAGDDIIDAGAGSDVVFASRGHNTIDLGEASFGALSAGARSGEEGEVIREDDRPFTIEQVMVVYRLMYGDNDPWLDIYFRESVSGTIEAVEGDGVPFSESDWDERAVFDDEGNRRYVPVIQVEFDLESPVIAATHVRQQLLDYASAPTGGVHAFNTEILADLSLLALADEADDFDDLHATIDDLRMQALDNARDAAGLFASLYVNGVTIFSEGADLVITFGGLVDGDLGLFDASLAALPFISRPVIDVGRRAIVRTDNGEEIFRRGGQDIPGLDRRAFRGLDSGASGVGWLHRTGMIRERSLRNGKITLRLGTPQNTTNTINDAHALTSETLANIRVLDGSCEYVLMNRSLRTATGRTDLGTQATRRADIIAVRRDGRVDLYEVLSPSQDPEDLYQKLDEMKAALPERNRGKIFVYDLNGQPVPDTRPRG
jgi:propanediol dehydratase small subunit